MAPEVRRDDAGAVTNDLVRRSVLVASVAAAIFLLVGILVVAIQIVFLVFGGVLLAVFLRALSDPIARYTPLTPGWALTVLILFLMGAFAGVLALFGPAAAEQIDALVGQVPAAVEGVREVLERYEWGQRILAAIERVDAESTLSFAQDLVSVGGWLLLQILTVAFVGLFLAARPGLYVGGFIRLFPRRRRPRAGEVMAVLGRTLRWFLIGRALAMTMVGVTTAAVLALLGVPLAGVLGLLAGLLTFVPYLGPLLGGVPILVVALVESPTLALWALLAYTAIQWIEGYILDPLIQQRMVELPPAITVVAQVLLGVLIGGIGVGLATPLAAVIMVLVQMLWVRDALGDRVQIGPRGFGKRKKSRGDASGP
jgi:predicted PurR-regulated permease PerM